MPKLSVHLTSKDSRTDTFGTYAPTHHHTTTPVHHKMLMEKLRKEVDQAKKKSKKTLSETRFRINEETDDFNRFVK